ncbi:MAG: P-type conjugative transfer protein TrbL [Acetobacter sp.]|nr:P-type conjugative transfer protein TrbL [Acetobacter sp.]
MTSCLFLAMKAYLPPPHKFDTMNRIKTISVLLLLLIVCLLIPLTSYAQSVNYYAPSSEGRLANMQVLTNTIQGFMRVTSQWKEVFFKAATDLFWILAPIGLVWRGGQILLRGEGLTEALAEFVRFSIFLGFYWWLLQNGVAMATDILNSLKSLAEKASDTDGINPSNIINLGFTTFNQVIDLYYLNVSFTNIGTDLMLFACILFAAIFACLCAAVAIRFLLSILVVWFLMYAGIFILGFGSLSWTSDMAINYFRKVFSASMRVVAIILITGVFKTIIESINNILSATTTQPNVVGNLNDILELLVTALMMYLLVKIIPEELSSVAKGILRLDTHQSDPANTYANALMNGYYAGGSAGGGSGGSRTVANIREAEQRAQQRAETLMAQHDAAKAEERARAATAYTKPESPKPPPTTSSSSDPSSSHYIHGVDFANVKYPNPDAPPPSDD